MIAPSVESPNIPIDRECYDDEWPEIGWLDPKRIKWPTKGAEYFTQCPWPSVMMIIEIKTKQHFSGKNSENNRGDQQRYHSLDIYQPIALVPGSLRCTV
jgi:hypothetical protein